MPEGCALTKKLTDSDAREIVYSLSARTVAANAAACVDSCRANAAERLWVLLHADSGVTWGIIDGTTVRLSCSLFQEWPTPEPDASALQQLRIFGAAGELLIWRIEDTPRRLAGRILADAPFGADAPPFARHRDVQHVVAASRFAGRDATKDGFTAAGDATGRIQVLPWSLTEADFVQEGHPGAYPLVLRIREYFERDLEDGSVRVAASRLLELRLRSPRNKES